MKRVINFSLVWVMVLGSIAYGVEDEKRERLPSARDAIRSVSDTKLRELLVVDNVEDMFTKGKVTGQVRSIYSNIAYDNATDVFAMAIGGQLKYESAILNGFNMAMGLATTYDVGFIRGNGEGHNDRLSGSNHHYTEITEAYLNYVYQGLTLRVGRQGLDTPLADSDDVRMISNTFEAYTASVKIDNFSLMAGHLLRWQGADAGLDDAWTNLGDNGVSFVGISYATDRVDANAWYYNISNASMHDSEAGADENGNNSIYLDVTGHFSLHEDIALDIGVQYLRQDTLDSSNVQADIYGVRAELIVSNLGINMAYNRSKKKNGKHSFSGYGGGTLFTNMDTMIIDEITEDRDATSLVFGLSYEVSDFNVLYAYGDFSGDKNSLGVKAHIVEQNIAVEYTPNDDVTLGAIYVMEENKEDARSQDFNSNNFRVLVSYNF